MGQDLLLNGEVDGESLLFLSSGPLLAKALDEYLGVELGGFGFGGVLLEPILGRRCVDLGLKGLFLERCL